MLSRLRLSNTIHLCDLFGVFCSDCRCSRAWATLPFNKTSYFLTPAFSLPSSMWLVWVWEIWNHSAAVSFKIILKLQIPFTLRAWNPSSRCTFSLTFSLSYFINSLMTIFPWLPFFNLFFFSSSSKAPQTNDSSQYKWNKGQFQFFSAGSRVVLGGHLEVSYITKIYSLKYVNICCYKQNKPVRIQEKMNMLFQAAIYRREMLRDCTWQST